MMWDHFIYIAVPALLCWAAGAWCSFREKRKAAILSTILGILIFAVFIGGLWMALERPPLRTMGETRLWYAFFLPFAGLLTYLRWPYRWILSFSTLMAFVFICINIFKPEIHNKTLMPALQSAWFAPHVIVYMFSYALLGAAAIVSVWLLLPANRRRLDGDVMLLCDNLVWLGTAFLTIGMLFGALWAKEAWGHYWSWDPKETWAGATWMGNLLYIHFRLYKANHHRTALYILIFSFILLQICWYGVNYLPSAQGNSIHIYS